MKTKPLSLTLKACLLLLVTALCPEIAMSQTAAQDAISHTAAAYGLGRPRAESPEARQTPAPRSEGWWQVFESGWVYWHPRYGVQVVRGEIFYTWWGGNRWEALGALGFPTSGESQCRFPDSNGSDRFQVFERGRIWWRVGTHLSRVFNNPTNFGEGGNCTLPPPPPPPDPPVRVFSAPYTSAGTSGDDTSANSARGSLYLWNNMSIAGSRQKVVFISQTLPVERGIRNVHVSARLDVFYSLYGLTLGPGYSSAEAIVNLRVFQRGQVVCSDRISLERLITAVVGEGDTSNRRPVTLQCDFTRPIPRDATTYTLIADIEGWAGAGGWSRATVTEDAILQRFLVYLHRR